jgi:rootletin
MDYRFSNIDDRLQMLEINNRVWRRHCKSLTKKIDLSNARRVASNMSRNNLHLIARNAIKRANRINDQLQTADHQMRELEREHTKLQAQCDRLETELNTSKEEFTAVTSGIQQEKAIYVSQHASLETKAQELEFAQQQLRQVQADMTTLQKQHSRDLTAKDTQISTLQEEQAIALSTKDDELRIARAENSAINTRMHKQIQDQRTRAHDVISRKDREITSTLQQHTTAIAAKDAELEACRAEHAEIVACKDAEHADIIARKNAELEDSSNQHAAAITTKDRELEISRNEQDEAIAQKDAELDASRLELASVTKQKDAEAKHLREQLALAVQQKHDKTSESSNQSPDAETRRDQNASSDGVQRSPPLSEVQLKRQVGILQQDIHRQDAKIAAMEQEWGEILYIIQDANCDLPRILSKFGKKAYGCDYEISDKMNNDPQSKL